MAKKESFEERISLLKKEIENLRKMVGQEYDSRMNIKDNNGLIFLKRNKDKLTKAFKYIFNVKPLPHKTKKEGMENKDFREILRNALDNLLTLNNFLETKVTKADVIKGDEEIYFNNLDSLKMALKCLKGLEFKRDLFPREK